MSSLSRRFACLLILTLAPLSGVRGQQPLTDRHGDPLPPGAVMRLGSVRFLHIGSVHSLAFLPGDKQILSGAGEGFSRLWDRTTGREVRRFASEGYSVCCTALSRDGKRVAAGDNGGDLIVRDVATAKTLHGILCRAPLRAVAWSPDGRTLAYEGRGGIDLLDADTGQVRRQLNGSYGRVRCLLFHPGGKELISSTEDDVFRVWDVAAGKELRQLGGRPGGAGGRLACSPDGAMLAADCSHSVRLWNAAAGKKILDLDSGPVVCIAFSPDGKRLATGDSSRRICLWDPVAGKLIRHWFGHAKEVTALAFSSNGKTLASGGADGRIRLWNPTTGKETFTASGHAGPVRAVAFSPDGKTVVSGGQDRALRFWDWLSGEEKQSILDAGDDDRGVGALAYALDGRTVASLDAASVNNMLRLHDVRTAKTRARGGPTGVRGLALAFLPGGNWLLTTHGDGSFYLWDGRTGQLRRRIGQEIHPATALAASSDGGAIAWAGEEGGISFVDPDEGKGKRWAKDSGGYWRGLVFSPDGALLAALGRRGGLRIWSRKTGAILPTGAAAMSMSDVAFSPDGTLLAGAVGQSVVLWDVPSCKPIRVFTGHAAPVQALAFAPTGKVLVSAGFDGSLLVWDVSGALVKGRLAAVVLSDRELQANWDALTADPVKAQRAIWSLAACPQALPFVQKHLPPIPNPGERLARLIADLDDESFAVRQSASAELAALNNVALPALEKALANRPTLEVHHRITQLLQKIKPLSADEQLRIRRGVAVLARNGDPEARRLLRALAAGAPGAVPTEQAKAALRGLPRLP